MLVSFLVFETHDGTKLTKFAPVAASDPAIGRSLTNPTRC